MLSYKLQKYIEFKIYYSKFLKNVKNKDKQCLQSQVKI